METAREAFDKTIKFVNRKYRSLMHPEFSDHSEMYTFTTENIAGYLDKLDVKGKDILTVTASGDHLINMFLGGANNVDCYDSNVNTYYFTMLKLAALEALSYDEFINFFVSCERKETAYMGLISYPQPVNSNNYVYNYNTYQKIRPYLSSNISEYWDLMYQEYNYDGVMFDKKGLLMGASLNDAITSNLYLQSEELYLKAREACKNKRVTYYNCDVLELHNIPKTYDVILLSNIYDYVTSPDFGPGMSTDDYVSYAENMLSNNLNLGGKIGITYQYHYKTKKNMINVKGLRRLFADKYNVETKPELDKYKFKKVIIPSVVEDYRKDGGKDCLYVYEKGRVK